MKYRHIAEAKGEVRTRLIFEEVIKEYTGIELKWTEKAALGYYIKCFKDNQDELKVWGVNEGWMRFLDDYFDINVYELSDTRKAGMDKEGKIVFEEGMGFLGTPEFKRYCQERVQMWRDERELI